MIICISGFAGSGKDTAGKIVAERLALRHICFSFKDEAARRKMDLMDFQKLANNNEQIDKEMDSHIIEEANKGNCVVTTWLGPWNMPKADIKVWLEANETERSKRVAKRDNMATLIQAMDHVKKRDEDNISRYFKHYKIDMKKRDIFDIVIRSDKFSPEDIAEIIICAANKKTQPAPQPVKKKYWGE